jgi:hypothetical protein
VERLTGFDLKGFDNAGPDTWFAHSFRNLPASIAGAKLRIRLRSSTGFPANDTIEVGFTEGGGAFPQPKWSRVIATLVGGAGWYEGRTEEFTFDLSALPLEGGGTTNLLYRLSQLRYLDVYVQDDTLVDYVALDLNVCACQPDIVIVPPPGGCQSPATFALPVFIDACDTNPVVTCSPPSGSIFPIGTNLVVCSAIDDAGNVGRCVFNVTIQDGPDAGPRLAIRRESKTNHVVIISWPVTCASYQLEETMDLNSPIQWSPTIAYVDMVGGRFQVTVIAVGNKFYRLRRQ